MYNICVFAGTTEGRKIIEFLVRQPVCVTACVATEYGETLLEPAENLTISSARLTAADMIDLLTAQTFDIVIDATHPYAAIVTENIVHACDVTRTPYLRLLRETNAAPKEAIFVSDIASAVQYLNRTQGTILLTTGSKELAAYTAIDGFAERVYARVLPMEHSLTLCQKAGLPPAHILAMQGPFSLEMNTAMLHAVNARYMVTKESGKTGGFDEKIAAAAQADVTLVVIGRPPQQEGVAFSEAVSLLCNRFGFHSKPQVTIVGIGPGNRKAMTAEVSAAISNADCIIGAKRMLEAAAGKQTKSYDAIAPSAISDYIHQNPHHHHFTVVMSGDVGFFSGTKKLLPLLADCDVTVLPGLSSLVYLCSRLKTSYEDVVSVSMHGRDHNILHDVTAHKRIFTLVGGENGMGKLCQSLADAGMGDVTVHVGENLSYPNETITTGTAAELAGQVFENLSAALIEHTHARQIVTHGLPDEAFLRNNEKESIVPMTKSEVRSVCLSKLQLNKDSICWDIGAGTGSVAIEMALQATDGHVYAIERKADALALLEKNRTHFCTENVSVISGIAPDICADLPTPTHVFIGGSSGNMHEIISLLWKKNPDIRIVATAIALESIAELTDCIKTFPFAQTEVISMSVARDRKAGAYHLMTGQNPIYIFTMQAGGDNS